MLIIIVYLQPNFLFYRLALGCIQVVILGMFLIFLLFLCIGISVHWHFWISFVELGCVFHVISFFLNCSCLTGNSTFDSWFIWYTLGRCFYVGGNIVFMFVINFLYLKNFVKIPFVFMESFFSILIYNH